LHIGAELGLALAHAGQAEEGRALLNELLSAATVATPVPVTAALKILGNLLWVLSEAGQPEAALASVRAVEAPLAAAPAYQLHRGLAELTAEQHAPALAWLERFRATWTADELDTPVPVGYPGVRLWEALARCHLGLRDFAAAATCYERCSELQPAEREWQLRRLVAERMMHA
jgi:tetratricopeptide (TPR) repeat protein